MSHSTSILDHGAAIGDIAATTQAFADAIAALPDGGTVHVPPGLWTTGTIALTSGITLDLHPAATILGSPNLDDYHEHGWGQHIDRTPWHLIVAIDCQHIAITGGGTIDGNGPAFWEPVTTPEDGVSAVVAHESDPQRAALTWIKANKEQRPSPMLEITGCEHVRIDGVQIRNSAGWDLHLHNCRKVWLTRIDLDANLMGPNNDGFDITGCQDVMVSDCSLSCCDDAIVLKTTPDSGPNERITVTGCTIRSRCAALKLGASESFHDMRQIAFSNCVVYESQRVVALHCYEGATYEDIVVSNITGDTRLPFAFNRVIHIEVKRKTPTSSLGRIHNVQISNLVCATDGRVIIAAEEPGVIDNIVLRDVRLSYPTVDDPGLITIDDGLGQFFGNNPWVRHERACVVAENVDQLVLSNLMVDWPTTDADGTMQTPAGWHHDLKGRNGTWALHPRGEFNSDTLPAMAVVSARQVTGLVDCPLANPSGTADKYRLVDSDLIQRA